MAWTIRRPARTARSASSSCVTGAPNRARMPSPARSLTVPPNSSTAWTMRARASPTMSLTSSGSSRSARAVEPTKSAKSAVTTLRSSRIAGEVVARMSTSSGMTGLLWPTLAGLRSRTLVRMRFRYSRWDGTQDPLGPDLSAGDVLEAMSDELLSGQSVDRTLSQLLRRGMRGRFSGLDALRARLRQARRNEHDRLNLEGPLQEIQERLAELLEAERRTPSFKAEDDARLREQFLDSLPPDPAGQVRELKDYRFVDPEAQRKFDELLERLKEQVLGSYFRGMAEGMRGVSPEELRRFRDMLSELNSMIEARDRGEHTPADFDAFMHRYGDFFPEHPTT